MPTVNYLSALDYIPTTLHAAIKAGTNNDDLSTFLQAWLDDVSNNECMGVWPAGTYHIDTSLYVTRETPSTFLTSHIRGDGGGYAEVAQVILRMRDDEVPALIVDLGRGVVIQNISIIGEKNNIFPSRPTDDPDDYVPVGMRRSAQSPYCAIAIDATSGSVPVDGGYPGLTYGDGSRNNSGSKNIRIVDVSIRGFVVGVMISPANSAQGEQVIVDRCHIGYCEYAYSAGQPQARACVVDNSDVQFCRIGFECNDHGAKQGVLPVIENTQLVFIYRCFESSDQFGIGVMRGCYMEQINVIGTWGYGFSRTKFPMTIYSSTYKYLPDDGVSGPPFPAVVMENSATVRWEGCYFICNLPTDNFVMNFIGEGRKTFANCIFSTQWRGLLNVNASIANTNDGSPQADFFNCLITSIDDPNPFDLHDYSSQAIFQVLNITGGNPAVTYTDTQIIFDSPEAGSVSVGQLCIWALVPQGDKSLDTTRPAALVISDITANTITFDRLFERAAYDETNWHFGLINGALVTTRTAL